MAGKRPAASEDVHGAAVARRGTGEATLEWEKTGGFTRLVPEGGGEVFGLERPGGGPVYRSMLGAEAQRAEREVEVCDRERDRKSMRREKKNTKYSRDGGGKSQRSDGQGVSLLPLTRNVTLHFIHDSLEKAFY